MIFHAPARRSPAWCLSHWHHTAGICLAGMLIAGTACAASGLPPSGSYTYFSASQCSSSGKFSSEICQNAEINARAEFEEKMPAFPTRAACERSYGRGRCNIVPASSMDCKGGPRGICFMVRGNGFRIVVRSSSQADVVPLGPRGPMAFSTRTVLRKMASRSRKTQALVRQRSGVSTPSGPWVSAPAPGKTSVPRAAVDKNFDCSLVVETRPGEDPNTFCYPARKR